MTITRPASSDPAQITGQLWAGWEGALAFDVGANCGQSLPLLLDRFEQVVAFEPAAESWEVLAAEWAVPGAVPAAGTMTISADGRVVLVHAAVSDTSGEVDLWETPGNLAQGQLISPGHHAFTRECQPEPRKVPAITIDQAAAAHGHPDFVKVDVEGHELQVLKGAVVTLGLGCGWLIEFHSPAMHDQCEGVLLRSGHRVETVRHPHYPPGTEDWYNHGWLRASA